jgi:hypothetical protein
LSVGHAKQAGMCVAVKSITIVPPGRPLVGRVTPPGS